MVCMGAPGVRFVKLRRPISGLVLPLPQWLTHRVFASQLTCNNSTGSCSSALEAGADAFRMSMLPVR